MNAICALLPHVTSDQDSLLLYTSIHFFMWSACYLADINKKWNWCQHFTKNTPNTNNSPKSVQWEPNCSMPNGQTYKWIWQSWHQFLANGLRTRPWTDRGSRLCGCELDRTVKRRGSYGEILWWKRWTFWSHNSSTSLNWTELLKGEDRMARSCDGRDEHSGAITAVHRLIKRITTNYRNSVRI
jgi:hypothetical protein